MGQWLLLLVLIGLWIKTIFFRNSVIDFEAWCPFGGLQSMITRIFNTARYQQAVTGKSRGE